MTRWINRTRVIVMDLFDEAMLTFALSDLYPTMRIVDGIRYLRTPRLDERPSLCQSDFVSPVLLFPKEDWSPVILPDLPSDTFYFLANAPNRRIYFTRSRWFWGNHFMDNSRWGFSLPTPMRGQIAVAYRRERPGEVAFVQSVWRVLNRLSTNRMKSIHPHSQTLYLEDTVRGETWAGHHVLEWCREPYDRVLGGASLRPRDDWRAPDTQWHRDLRRRVIEKFGSDFGVPDQPPSRDLDSANATSIAVLMGPKRQEL